METSNDVDVNGSAFDPASISEETKAFNQKLMDIMSKVPKWYQVGAEEYRGMRARGETPIAKPIYLESAETHMIPSREQGRSIPCRVIRPETQNQPIKGVFMHIHGGGWVLQDEKSQDITLQDIANSTGVLVISIGYRLAPEHPYPAGPQDCFDAAEWLVINSLTTFRAPLAFIGGESAGGHLAVLSALHLLQHPDPRFSARSKFALRGLILHFGCYDLTWTPSVYNFQKPTTLILDKDLLDHYVEAFLPGNLTIDQKRDPHISPLYADLQSLRGQLPAALFTCGTEDPLLDDTVFMSARWQAAGAPTTVKIFPGAPHTYIGYPRSAVGSMSAQGLDAVADFVTHRLS